MIDAELLSTVSPCHIQLANHCIAVRDILLLFGMQAQHTYTGRRNCLCTWAVVLLLCDVEFEEYLGLMSSGAHMMNTQAQRG